MAATISNTAANIASWAEFKYGTKALVIDAHITLTALFGQKPANY